MYIRCSSIVVSVMNFLLELKTIFKSYEVLKAYDDRYLETIMAYCDYDI